ncbi:MAG: hypothetical protein OXE86_09335 [Alphaproteobacteria bacterium]|nr:hypothetical protein [Alphaproteobacteria bacterium]
MEFLPGHRHALALVQVAAVCAVALVWQPPAASAHCSCVAASGRNHATTQRLVKGWLDDLERAIVEALRAQTEQLSNYSRLEIEAAERIADAQEQAEARRERQRQRAAAETQGRYDPDPNGCLTVERAGWPAYAGAPEADLPDSGTAVREAVEESPERSEGGARYAVKRAETRTELADKGVSTTDVSEYLAPVTTPRSHERVLGARELAQNLIDPMMAPELTDAYKRVPAGAVLDARLDQVRAQQAVVRETIAYLLAMREGRTAPDGTPLRAPEIMSKFVDKARYFADLPSGAVSEMQSLDLMTTYHAEPQPEEAAQRETALTERNWLSRLHAVSALNARINFLRLEVETRAALLSAAAFAKDIARLPPPRALP